MSELTTSQPAAFVLDWRSIPKQQELYSGDEGIDIGIAGVGAGKTKIAAAKMLLWALEHPRRRDGTPTHGLVLGRDFKIVRSVQLKAILEQAERVCFVAPGDQDALTRELAAIDNELGVTQDGPRVEALTRRRREILIPIPYEAVVRRVLGGEEPRIELANGVVLHGFSSVDPNRLRGPGFDFCWLDEADFQSDRGFAVAMSRQRAAECIRMVVTSSPESGAGWLWRMVSGEHPEWDELRTKVPLRVHRWRSDDNPEIRAQVLAPIRAVLEATVPGIAKQELDGRFVGTHEAPGAGPFEWARAFCGPLTLAPGETRAAVLGVDLAQKVDFTWLTVLSETGVVLFMERFNESTLAIGPDAFFPYVERRIVELVNIWNVPLVKMDTAWTGAAVAQLLAQTLRGRARVEGYKTDQQTKRDEAIEALGVAMARGSIRIPTQWTGPDGHVHPVPSVEQLRLEFQKLVTVEEGLKRHFRHPSGGHDDGVVSLALAWQGVTHKPNPNAPNPYGPLPPRVRRGDDQRCRFPIPNVRPSWRDLPPSPWRR